jgi:uncharacterized RDD family membrane protein YckC
MSVSENLRGFYAGFVSRLVAFFVDSVIISVSLGVAAGVISTAADVISLQGAIDLPSWSGSLRFTLAGIVVALFTVLYFVLFWSFGGRTPGKALMGLRVVTTDGERLIPRRALLRFIGYVASTAIFCFGFAMILADNRRQGLHDKLARSLVIYDWEAHHGERLAHAREERRQAAKTTDVQPQV